MNKRTRSKLQNLLLDVKDSREYLEGLTKQYEGITLAIIKKNLHYAVQREKQLITQLKEEVV
jgi:uncharacterized protein (DUF433 family)